jgi:hypothetical protein
MTTHAHAHTQYVWKCEPQAEALIVRVLDEACRRNYFLEQLSHELLKVTSTRLFDWLDYIVVGTSPSLEKELDDTGFVVGDATPTSRVFHHPGAQLPRVVVNDHDQAVVGVAINVESIADFLMVHGISAWIEGSPFSGFRRCCVSTDDDVSVWVVERRGTMTIEPTYNDEGYLEKFFEAKEKWKSRPRKLFDEDEMMHRTLKIAEEIVCSVGRDLAAAIILECEREFWQSRNLAGQMQKGRQDRLGMGWANHDHHTFRSSRKHFTQLVRLFEMLGFHCRERFYAGKEAGWGAQVMENPNCRLVLFLDVDLAPHELEIDFSHHPLPELPALGTIGLWCALHGDSILKSGMHHLEAQFMFDELKEDLAAHGIGMMDPFSSFPYLKQAFTHGEIWHVDPKNLQALLERGVISREQADKFSKYGAVGSHLENLQRREGYKGFNQKNVSVIIKKTDPREM